MKLDKYDLKLDWGEVSTKRKLPRVIYDRLESSKVLKYELSNSNLVIYGAHYIVQAFVKDMLSQFMTNRQKLEIDSSFDEIRQVKMFDKVWAISQEEWSFNMKMRWSEMEKEIVEALHKMWLYRRLDSFIVSLSSKNHFTDEQVKVVIQMGEEILQNPDLDYSDLIQNHLSELTDIELPNEIWW